MSKFEPGSIKGPQVGLVLRLQEGNTSYLRVTHAFKNNVYLMAVDEAAKTRDAKRPFRMRLADLEQLGNESFATCGHLPLPESMSAKILSATECRRKLRRHGQK